MSVTSSYSSLLKRYTPEKLIMNEFAEKNYIWKNIEKDESWMGGTYEVPVQKNGFNSVQMGSLPSATDIAEGSFAVGTISTHKELVLSAIINEADLSRHGNMEQSYLKILPDMVDGLSRKGIELMNSAFLRGVGVISFATANGAVGGTITVANPEYFEPMMKIEVIDDDTAAVAGYITAVDINTGVLTVQNARSAGANVDLSTYTTAQNARVRIVGSGTETFLDIISATLPAANGGSDTIYGLTKASYLPLQAFRVSGAAYTANTILKDLLGAYFANRRLGRGNPSEIWVNFGMFKNISALLETQKHYYVKDKAAGYGFNSLSLVGVEGEIKIVALKEMPTDKAYIVDWKALKFAGLPLKRKMYGEAGLDYFPVRNTTGVQFISDMILRGDFVINPSKLGVVYAIPSSVSA